MFGACQSLPPGSRMWFCTTTPCNALQHTATHCNKILPAVFALPPHSRKEGEVGKKKASKSLFFLIALPLSSLSSNISLSHYTFFLCRLFSSQHQPIPCEPKIAFGAWELNIAIMFNRRLSCMLRLTIYIDTCVYKDICMFACMWVFVDVWMCVVLIYTYTNACTFTVESFTYNYIHLHTHIWI